MSPHTTIKNDVSSDENLAPPVIVPQHVERAPSDQGHDELYRAETATSERSSSIDKSLDKEDKETNGLSPSSTHGHHHHHHHHHKLEAVRSAAHAARRKLHLDSIHASGPSDFFNPTNIRVHVRWRDGSDSEREKGGYGHGHDEEDDGGDAASGRALLWRSRDNRKGRNSISVPSVTVRSPRPVLSRARSEAKRVWRNVLKMLFSFHYWDMAFWSGWAYTWGSVLFVMDGSWAFTEVAFPGAELEGLSKYGGPICFFVGALLYQLGAVMAYLEAVNDGSFQGSAMRRLLDGHEDDAKRLLDERIHSFFSNLVRNHAHRGRDEEEGDVASSSSSSSGPGGGKVELPRRGAIDLGAAEEGSSATYMTWRWWPTWRCLKTHHVYEIGYIACAIQLFGATLYAICGVVTLPGILSSLQHWQKEAAFWVPQIVASCCFLTAGVFFTLETQERWWRPELKVIGWWIGFWATVGSVGFLLCAIFGSASYDVEWGEYMSDLSSTWGSFAYLLSGLLQWYEATNKNPVEELFNEPGPMKSFQVHGL